MATAVGISTRKQPEDFARKYRRRQLIDATIAAIAEHGLSRITLAKVAGVAELSPGIVNFYFKSKQQLLLETLQEMAEEFDDRMQAAITAHEDPARALTDLVDAFFDPAVFSIEKVAVWSAFWGESRARQDYLQICGEKDEEFFLAIHDLFSRLRRDTGSDLDTHAAAKGFEGLLNGHWQEFLCDPGSFDQDRIKRTCIAYLKNHFPASFQVPLQSDPAADEPGRLPLRTMMAPWAYSNKEFFDLEVNRIFKRNWLLAGHISDLKKPGDFITFNAVGERAIVVRGAGGKLRAFHNVCRHRGGRIVRDDKGNCKRAIVCPFHGWTYHLDGTLKNVPAADTFANLDKNSLGLVPMGVEVWNGFVFLRFGGNGRSVTEMLKPVEHRIAPYQPEKVEPLWPTLRETRRVNWKVVHDIDNEGYHVPIGHPGLHALFGKNYEDRTEDGVGYSFGRIRDKPARQWSVAKYQKLLPRYDHLPEENQRIWQYFSLFPNLVFEFHPDCMLYYMTLPVAPGETVYMERYFALPDSRQASGAARYLSRRINDQVGFEDESFVDWVQQGLRSSALPEATLSNLEWGVSAFHQEIQSALPVGRLAQEPAPGSVERVNDSMTAE